MRQQRVFLQLFQSDFRVVVIHGVPLGMKYHACPMFTIPLYAESGRCLPDQR
jgi:hypothetical protein